MGHELRTRDPHVQLVAPVQAEHAAHVTAVAVLRDVIASVTQLEQKAGRGGLDDAVAADVAAHDGVVPAVGVAGVEDLAVDEVVAGGFDEDAVVEELDPVAVHVRQRALAGGLPLFLPVCCGWGICWTEEERKEVEVRNLNTNSQEDGYDAVN